jgi:molybdenum cofactor cytidylyltransferase
MSCGIVILAAGSSSRLGRPKQRVQFQGKTLLNRAIETALATSCRPIVVVLGCGGDELAKEIASSKIVVRLNADWQNGIGTSIKAGVAAIAAAGCYAVALVLCDQPLVKAEAIEKLVQRRAKSGKPICAAGYADTIGTPAVFAADLFEQLLNLSDAEGGKAIISRHLDETETMKIADAAMDVDTEADVKKLSQD